MRLKRALIFAFALLSLSAVRVTACPPFDAEKSLSDVRLVFGFPYCALKKNEKKEND